MEPFVLLPLLMSLAFFVVGGIVVLAFVLTASSGRNIALPRDPTTPVVVQAHLIRPEQTLSLARQFDESTYGTITVTATDLRWSSGPADPGWAVPLHAVAVVAVHGALVVPSIDLDIAGSGRWRLTVSDRRINRFSRNTAKNFREARMARELAGCLIGRGARDATAPIPRR